VSSLSNPKSVNLSALVGIKANIYGYTSPDTKVELKSTNAYAITTSNSYGYWQFLRIYLPPISQELCFFQSAPLSYLPPLP